MGAISKQQVKRIRQLEQKKHRLAEGLFVAEGPKVVGDLLAVLPPTLLVATPTWAALHPQVACTLVDDDELRRISFLQHPQQVLGVFPLPDSGSSSLHSAAAACRTDLVMALDGVQDPGNLGTIIRLCDWFGISHLVCSRDTADAYNPKVVQATMGSIARVQVCYTDLPDFCRQLGSDIPVYGTLLDGDDLYDAPIRPYGLIVMGNEGNGLSPAMRALVSHRLLIPSYPPVSDTAESLNVAIAAAVVCAEFRRRALHPNQKTQ